MGGNPFRRARTTAPRPRRARPHTVRTLTVRAVTGVAVLAVASLTPATPAGALPASAPSAGLLDPVLGPLDPVLDPVLGPLDPVLDPVLGALVPPEPQILGPGSLTGPGGWSCASTGALTDCAPVLLDALDPLQPVLLQALPAPGFLTEWSGCPDPAGDLCTLAPSLLGGLVEPVAQFVPLPVLPGDGSAEPTTTLTAAETLATSTVAAFEFTGTPSTATFECRLDGPTGAHDWAACSSPVLYQGLTAGDHLFAVRATDGERSDATPAEHAWTTTRTSTAPETRITRGPADDSWVLTKSAIFGYASTVPGSTFECRLDEAAHACTAEGIRLRKLAAGTHTFSVTAVTGFNRDLTPAARQFSVPLDDRALKRSKGDWAVRKQAGHFRKTYLQTRERGADLRTKVRGMTGVALVADTGRGFGTVKVYSGKRMIKTVRLAGQRPEKQVLVPLGSFLKPQTRTVRLVVASKGKPVRIDGLAVRHG